MNRHRQYMTSKRVGDPSSKYGYGRSFDNDIESKQNVIRSTESNVTEKLEEFIVREINYLDGNMSIEQKYDCIIEAVKRIKTKYSL